MEAQFPGDWLCGVLKAAHLNGHCGVIVFTFFKEVI